MGGLIQDLRYAARMLKRTPGFTAVVVLTLALGIGANTAIFSLIDALFLKPLPVEDATRLVEIHQTLAWRRDQLGFTLSYRTTSPCATTRAFSRISPRIIRPPRFTWTTSPTRQRSVSRSC